MSSVEVDLVFVPNLGSASRQLTVLVHPHAMGAAALALDEGAESVTFSTDMPSVRVADLVHGCATDMSGAVILGDVDMQRACQSLEDRDDFVSMAGMTSVSQQQAEAEPDGVTRAYGFGFLNARPAAATIARALAEQPDVDVLQVVCICAGGSPSVDSVVAAGYLFRLLFEESDRSLILRDAAGMALSVASTYGNFADACATSSRARRAGWNDGAGRTLGVDESVEPPISGAHWIEDLRTAAQTDVAASVPRLVDGRFVC